MTKKTEKTGFFQREVRKKKKEQKLFYEFQPDVVELIEKPISPIGRWIVKVICLFLLLLTLFAYFGKINVVSTASGIIKPVGEAYRVQMPKTSTIVSMNVQEGAKVEKGTTLFTLADEQNFGVDNQSNEKLLQQAQLEKQALSAVYEAKPLTEYLSPEEIAANPEVNSYYQSLLQTSQTAVSVLENERTQQERTATIYEQQKQAIQAEISNAETQIVYLEERKKQASDQAELAQLESQLQTAQKEEADYEQKAAENKSYQSIWENKKAERENKEAQIAIKNAQMAEKTIELDSQISNYRSTITKLTADLATQEESKQLAQAKAEELNLQIESTRAEEKNKLSALILEKNKEIEQYQVALTKGQQFIQDQTVAAPIAGTIGEILTDEFGKTLPQAQQVLTIVPEDAPLYIEIAIKNQDIGYVHVGQKVELKVAAFPFQKYGVLEGKVTYISPNAEKQEDQQMMYKAKVELAKKQTKFRAESQQVLVGMNVTADIEIGRRRLIDFFFEPITKYLDESFKQS